MAVGFLVSVQSADGLTLLGSERKILDPIRAQQWIPVQAFEASIGDVIILRAVDSAAPIPAGWPFVLAASGGGGDTGGGVVPDGPTPLPVSFEAETGTLSGGAIATANIPGFIGAGYVDIATQGASVAFPAVLIGGA